MKLAMIVSAVMLTAGAAAAQGDQFCRNGGFPMDAADFGLAKVKAGDRLHFLEEETGCISSRI